MRSLNSSASEDMPLGDAGRPQCWVDPHSPLLRCRHEPGAPQDHRQRQPLPHMQPGRLGEFDQLRVRLTDKLDAEAEAAVKKDEGTDELAGLVGPSGFQNIPHRMMNRTIPSITAS